MSVSKSVGAYQTDVLQTDMQTDKLLLYFIFSLSLFVCMFLSLYLSISLSASLSACQSLCRLVCLPDSLPGCMYPTIHLWMSAYICIISVCLTVCHSACLFVRLSVCLCVRLSVYLSKTRSSVQSTLERSSAFDPTETRDPILWHRLQYLPSCKFIVRQIVLIRSPAISCYIAL